MKVRLVSKTWDWLLDGCEALAHERVEQREQDEAEMVRELHRTLADLGNDRVGGPIEGYFFDVEIRGQKRRIEIRLAPVEP